MKCMSGVTVMVGLLLGACAGTSAESAGMGGSAGATSGGNAGTGAGGDAAGAKMGEAGSPTAPPPAQGASELSVMALTPAPAGKTCPVKAIELGIPDLANQPLETLTELRYLHKVIDGEDAVVFECKVSGSSTYSFEGSMQQDGRRLTLKNGTLSASKKGTAQVTIEDSQHLSSPLVSAQPCVVNAAQAPSNDFQVKAGSMWASFICPSVDAAPNTTCKASGIFVLENCIQ